MKIVISPCLLGRPVRYDGKSKPAQLPAWFADADTELIPFCPEVAAGLGTPRPPIELVAPAAPAPDAAAPAIRVVRVHDRADLTDRLAAACDAMIAQLHASPAPVDLFVLKARSPSCGISSPLHDADGAEIGAAPGIWAAAVKAHFPQAKIITEEELNSKTSAIEK
jgi:Uncharacterized conserved protein